MLHQLQSLPDSPQPKKKILAILPSFIFPNSLPPSVIYPFILSNLLKFTEFSEPCGLSSGRIQQTVVQRNLELSGNVRGGHSGLGVRSIQVVSTKCNSACRRLHGQRRVVSQGQQLGEHLHLLAGTRKATKGVKETRVREKNQDRLVLLEAKGQISRIHFPNTHSDISQYFLQCLLHSGSWLDSWLSLRLT